MGKKIVFKEQVGPLQNWVLTVYEDENGNLIPEMARNDRKFFRVILATKGYDRPVVENFGPSKVGVVINVNGEVAVEPEIVLTDIEAGETLEQDRIIRASFDNPNYLGVPEGIVTGENYGDSQRVTYRDLLPQSLASAVNEPPMRKTKEGFVPCTMLPLTDYAASGDALGKAAIFDAFASLMPEKLMEMGSMLWAAIQEKNKD